jgi:restriction endonuclease S subunit
MDQVINATQEFLTTQIAQKDERIQSLEEHIQRLTQRDYATAAELQRIRDNMHEWTLNALQEREISETNAEEIADICGFELVKEVEAEVTVTYNVTVQVPFNEDAEDIINDIDFESVSYNSDNITWLSATVDRIDI